MNDHVLDREDLGGGVLLFRLDRPEVRNALSTTLRDELSEAVEVVVPALAGGFDLATLCDLRVAQPGVWFSRPEVDFGVPMFEPLRELVGGAMARELCLSSRRVELEEAERIGLVTRVAGTGGAVDEAVALAREVAGRPQHLMRATKAKFVSAAGLAARPTLAL